ncbi:MAG TPA: glucose-1-phosphate thymidylyltransferase [Solirubrobacteraceae bacterium]|jgi:glucose-1-phosphate thymidylyltransferase
MKGLILSGGRGTRLRPITYTSAKQLIPVANKPVLFYGIEAVAAAGIEEVGIVIAPETGDEVRAAAGDGSLFGVRISYIVQDRPGGLAHAVLAAESFLDGDPFVMYLGDNLLQGGIVELADRFRASSADALILLTKVPDPEHYGVAELDGERVVRLVEKPRERRSDLALVGVYMFTARICDAARAIRPSDRGELEITDAIQHLIDSGFEVEPHIVQGWWKDTGQLADMLEANRLILDTLEPRCDGTLENSQLDGRVVVARGARLERSTVRGPAIIGARARLIDAYVGPYTAIGDDCVIESAEVEHSILLAGCEVRRLDGRVESSLLGRDVRISRDGRQPRAYRFMLGDSSEVRMP